jgi:hypothetical protein
MPLSAAFIQKLRSRGRRSALEVEDIVQVAVEGEPADAATLEEMVPVGVPKVEILVEWRLAACTFLRGGFEALDGYVDQSRRLSYACGILAEIKTAASVSSLLRLGARFPTSEHEVVSAVNLLMSFKGAPELLPDAEARVRAFLHAAVRRADSEPRRATAILGLRGVGDTLSLELLEGQAPLEMPWQDVLALTRSAIRRRHKRPPDRRGGQ